MRSLSCSSLNVVLLYFRGISVKVLSSYSLVSLFIFPHLAGACIEV